MLDASVMCPTLGLCDASSEQMAVIGGAFCWSCGAMMKPVNAVVRKFQPLVIGGMVSVCGDNSSWALYGWVSEFGCFLVSR